MTLSNKQFWTFSGLVFLCCLLFAVPNLLRSYREIWPEPKNIPPFNVVLPFGKNISEWGEKSLRIEWKMAVAWGKQTSPSALDDDIPVLYIAAILQNKGDKPLTVSSLSLLLLSDDVEVYSSNFGLRSASLFPLTIQPNQKITLQQENIIPSSVVVGLLENRLDISARSKFVDLPVDR
jgi:hypothetical protein